MSRALIGAVLALGLMAITTGCGGGSTTSESIPPIVAGVEPVSGGVGGGNTVVVKGEGLANAGVGVNEVYFGANLAENIVVVDDNTITCRTPPGPAGAVDVVIVKNSGATTVPGAYTYYPAPTFASITPDAGTRLGGTDVTVKGSGFLNNNPGDTIVMIGLKVLEDAVVMDDETIVGKTPTSFTEVPKDVTVTNNNGRALQPLAFTYFGPVPQVYSITPTTGPAAGGTPCEIKGEYFTVNGGELTITFGNKQAASVKRVDDQTMTCISPAGPGAEFVDVSVGNVNGTGVLTDAFYYIPPPPTLTACNPSQGVMTDNTPVTLTGMGFVNYNAGANTVLLGSVTPLNVVVVSDTTITCVFPAATKIGTYNITVTNNNGTATLVNGYTYFAPPMWAAKGSCSGGGLYKIDTAAWSYQQVGSTSSGMSGLAILPNTGVLYGWGDQCSGPGLYKLDKTTGAATKVGGSGGQADIAAMPTSGGSWKLVGYLFYPTYYFCDINENTGATTNVWYYSGFWYGNGYAYDANGKGYFAYSNTLYSVNPSSSSLSYIASLSTYPMQSMTFHQGKLYGNQAYGSDVIYEISTSSGALTSKITMNQSIDGIASEFP